MNDTAIRIEAVTRRFGGLAAVDNLSLSVRRGEIFGLLDPNGAGKTTCINLITGLLRRDCGEVEVLGYDPQIIFFDEPTLGVEVQARRRRSLPASVCKISRAGGRDAAHRLTHRPSVYRARILLVTRQAR